MSGIFETEALSEVFDELMISLPHPVIVRIRDAESPSVWESNPEFAGDRHPHLANMINTANLRRELGVRGRSEQAVERAVPFLLYLFARYLQSWRDRWPPPSDIAEFEGAIADLGPLL